MHYLSRLARYITDLHERGIEARRYQDPLIPEYTIISVEKDGVRFLKNVHNSTLSDDAFIYYIIHNLVRRLENVLARTCSHLR